LSRVLSASCLALAVVLPVLAGYYLCTSSVSALAHTIGIPTPVRDPTAFQLALLQRALVVALGAMPVLCMAYGLLCARHCFVSFAQGTYFSSSAVRGLRGFAAGVFFSVVASLAVAPLLSVVLTLGGAGAKPSMTFNIGSSQVLSLLFAGIVWQIAAVMTKAVALAEENAQFV